MEDTDIAKQLGILEAKAENSGNQIKTLFGKNDEQTQILYRIESTLTRHAEKSEARHRAQKGDISNLEKRLEKCEESNQEVEKLRWHARGALGVAAFLGVLSPKLHDLVAKWLI